MTDAGKLTDTLDRCGEGSLLTDVEMAEIQEVAGDQQQIYSRPDSTKTTAKNCDFKELILCDLIDDFLNKENEF